MQYALPPQEFALPKPLEQLLTSPLVRKVGVGLRDDVAKINSEFGIRICTHAHTYIFARMHVRRVIM